MKRFLAAAVSIGTLTALLTALPAEAFKPYTHVAAAKPALADATDDGKVTIGGREYAVRPQVVQALKDWPSYYQAGVIGPDGFPDLTFGQSRIHPDETGKWVGYLLREAWAAQSNPGYSAAERGQILAFAYGYATHTAGDMWAHTFVNDFAQGIFPGVGDIVTDVDKAEIALRHIIVEGYIGDATTGYDGNPNRTTLPDGDVSDDSTPGIAFDSPNRWIYDVLVNPNATLPVGTCGDGLDDDGDGVADDGCAGGGPFTVGKPEPVRGPLIDHFLDLKSDLQIQEAVTQADREREDCTLVDPDCFRTTRSVTVPTVRGVRSATYASTRCEAEFFCVDDPVEFAEDLAFKLPLEEYLEAWIDDINVGLEKWGELGLRSTRALFDPQTRRHVQNVECATFGPESTLPRINCEDKIGATEVLLHELEPFINNHLLSMLGAPDVVGWTLTLLGQISDFIDSVVGPALNPVRLVTAELKEIAKQLIFREIKRAYGVDVEVLSSFLKNPTYWLDVEQVSLDLGPLGTQQVDLFGPDDHERLDALLDLPTDHHVNRTINLPGGGTTTSSALNDAALFNDLEIFDNAVTTSKLVLLDADALNRVAGDQLAAAGVVKSAGSVTTYQDRPERPANVMVDGLAGKHWLTTIDGDHVWRENGLPRFAPGEDPEDPHGGGGSFPLWESCLLRPSFRTLFEDWETNPAWWPKLNDYPIDNANFPALGDPTGPDPSDTAAPSMTTVVGGGPVYVDGDGTRFVGPGSSVTVTASDTVFTDGRLDVESRLFKTGTTPPAWSDAPNGVAVPLGSVPDGRYTLETRAGDPCHAAASAPVTATEFVLDTAPPAIIVTSPVPEGVEFDTDDLFPITWTADDGPDGSGVASQGATLDGGPVSNGHEVDTFKLDAGLHPIVVTASDNLGNTGSLTRTFRVRATSASLLSNIERACAEGLITSNGACNGLRASLRAAMASHDAGAHRPTEVNQLGAVLNQVEGQLDKSYEPVFGARLVGWLTDLVGAH